MVQFLKSIFSNAWTYMLIIFIFIPTILAVDLVQFKKELVDKLSESECNLDLNNIME